MKQLSERTVRKAVKDTVAEVIADYKGEPDTDRETVIERLDEECDTLFGQLVRDGRIDQYDVDEMVETAQATATIIKVASEDAWVEGDSGLWEGLTYGVQASIAYFSLRNLLYKALERKGHDTNDDRPFERDVEEVTE